MDFQYNNKTYEIKVKHMSEFYDEYVNSRNIDIFQFYLDNDGIWRRTELKWLFDYLIKHEEYEKCKILNKVFKKHYVANKTQTIKLNNKLKKFLKQNVNKNV
jgi:hypothetical protein